jgi:hypothetical protein
MDDELGQAQMHEALDVVRFDANARFRIVAAAQAAWSDPIWPEPEGTRLRTSIYNGPHRLSSAL